MGPTKPDQTKYIRLARNDRRNLGNRQSETWKRQEIPQFAQRRRKADFVM